MGAFLRKYGTGTGADLYVPLIKRGVVDFALAADWTPAAGDVKVSKDGGAAANIGTLPTAVAMGNTAMWKISLADAELQGKIIAITVADSATKAVEDQMILVETFGHASALYPPDFGDATALGLARLDVAISSRSSHTPASVRTEMDTNSTKLANLDATVSSRLASASYTTPDNAGIAAAAISAASADSKTTAIKAKTDNLPADPASNTQVATRAAPGAAMTLTNGERTTLTAAVFAFAVEGAEQFVELLRLIRAVLLGQSDGFPAGPVHFRDKADTKNRITANTDQEGNRTAVTTDAT